MAGKVEVLRDSRYPQELSVVGPYGTIVLGFGRDVRQTDVQLIRSVLIMGELVRASKIQDAQKVLDGLTGGARGS